MTLILAAMALALSAAILPAIAQEIPRAVEQVCLAEMQAEVSQPCKTAISQAQADGSLPR